MGRRHSIRSLAALVPPVALTAPTFTGIPVRGQVLTGTAGTYSGGAVLTYQWQRDGGNIAGATSLNYTLVSADDATSIRLVETATNGAGAVSQTTAAAVTAPAFLIDSVDGWYHAGLGVTEVSLEMTDWTNSGAGGTSYNITQATGTRRPDVIVSDANFSGRASINFDGGDVMVAAAGAFWEVADGGDLVVFALVRPTTTGNMGVVSSDDISGGGFQINVRTDDNFLIRVGDGTVIIQDTSGGVAVDTVHAITLVLTGAASPSNDSIELFVDGTGSGSPATGDVGAIDQGGLEEFLIGALNGSGGSGLVGQIAEIGYYKGMPTAQEDADLTAYWNDYYGTSLPGVSR